MIFMASQFLTWPDRKNPISFQFVNFNKAARAAYGHDSARIVPFSSSFPKPCKNDLSNCRITPY